jgi:SAM-dependent methyltransferase
VQRSFTLFFLLGCVLLPLGNQAQSATAESPYTYKDGGIFGTGKWYMGREIAHVMGYQGMAWLERSDREAEENTSRLLRNMGIEAIDTIADIGAGSGYHVFQMAPMAKKGLIYAVDIQEEMLEVIRQKKKKQGQRNVKVVKGSETSIGLPENSVDKVLMVDVYHECAYPVEMIASVKKALRPDGRLYLIEYRGEDPSVPIKKLHKMTEDQAVRELKAAGFRLEKNIGNLPWQHCLVFVLQ